MCECKYISSLALSVETSAMCDHPSPSSEGYDDVTIPYQLGDEGLDAYKHKVQPLSLKNVFSRQNSLCDSNKTIALKEPTMYGYRHASSCCNNSKIRSYMFGYDSKTNLPLA